MFVKLNRPSPSVVADRLNWLTGLWISTVAPGTTAPVGSETTPVSDEFPDVCALPLLTQSAKQTIAMNRVDRRSQPALRNAACLTVLADPAGENRCAPSCSGKLAYIRASNSCSRLPL